MKGFEVYTWRPLPRNAECHTQIRPRLRFEKVEFSEIHPRISERRMCQSGPCFVQEWRTLRLRFTRGARG
jgi:hypothetical protein